MTRPADPSIRSLLLSVEKPGRYSGGEYGAVRREGNLSVALSYPDLYEIGMSNNAVRILYRRWNRIDGVRCERVFAPAADLEHELRKADRALFSLETRRPLEEFDFIAFSVGYELNATTVLQILDCGRIPLRAEERGEGHPLVIGGGPGLVNPVPWLGFFDFIYIGEAEGWIEAAFRDMVELKKRRAGRRDLAAYLNTQEALVSRAKPSGRRAIWTGFGREEGGEEEGAGFPVPSIRAAHDHGTIEIMRGCPNGCRFCNAGFLYRPFRLKPAAAIARQAYDLVFGAGFRELSLSSLSTGDYPRITELMLRLNRDFAPCGTSFSLPSLKINSLALELFREIKTVRRSGLTFAIETPCADGQRRINKLVPVDKTIALLREAKTLGWRRAKFYFMLGLPGYIEKDETDLILDCLFHIMRETNLSLHINVSTFVPKPHTPFQWCGQLEMAKARERIEYLRSRLRRGRCQVSFNLSYQSFLEGLIARGDARVGGLVLRAFRLGARLDAWEEHVKTEVWEAVIAEAGWDAAREVYRAKKYDEKLPWHGVDIGVSQAALRREAERAACGELTSPCTSDCTLPCGVCGKGLAVEPLKEEEAEAVLGPRIDECRELVRKNEAHRVLFAFSKTGNAVYLSHLNVMTVLERAFLRAGYFCRMTGGFNPKPIMEFANPLPLGFESRFDAAMVELFGYGNPSDFRSRMNQALPEGLRIIRAKELPVWRPGQKKHSLMSLFWGGDYLIQSFERTARAGSSNPEEMVFFRQRPDGRSWIVRLGGGESRQKVLRRFFADTWDNSDFLKRFVTIRLMSLARDERGNPRNYFDVF